jgi:hypothetical protein
VITPDQARQAAIAATADPEVTWRVIVTDPAGHALAVTRIPRRRPAPSPSPRPGAGGGNGLTGRVTITIPTTSLPGHDPAPPADRGPLGRMLAAAQRAAARAAREAAGASCGHRLETPAYRPGPRLREYVNARDVTCRLPTCRQPAWRGDLDHTIPYQHGGRTCACNLGGRCRTDHILKQHPRWQLTQPQPAEFAWTTPTGRTYTTGPDTHPV